MEATGTSSDIQFSLPPSLTKAIPVPKAFYPTGTSFTLITTGNGMIKIDYSYCYYHP